jgi:CubicO group peptidase (beta-lactamase class C family)
MKKSAFIAIAFLIFTFHISPAQITPTQIDSLVERTLKTFDVPGIAVAIVKDGKIIHAKGYGVRSLNNNKKVDENTLFGIASNSKAFTAAALGMLVDENKIKWNDKVTDYIPEFKLYDPYVTAEFTIKDLLTHRSGLGLGAGDLMMFPDSNNFTKNDIIHNLRYLKPVSSFRTKYDYDNNLYIVAGEVVARVSGKSWEDFIEQRIMQPLGMYASAASMARLKNKSNIISAHAPVDGKVQAIQMDWSETANAAGGIYSNLTDMSKWIIMQMNNGKYGDSLKKKLFSWDVHEEMWSPQTIIEVHGPSPYNTHFAAYGLGWFLADVKGYKQASHTGGLAGIVTQVTLLPELKLGIIVLTNQQSGAAFTAITNTIKDSYLGITGIDRVKQQSDRVQKNLADAKAITTKIWTAIEAQQKNTTKTDMNLFTGTYNDNWFGDVVISIKNGKPWFDSKRSPRLTGQLLPYMGNTFIVKWNDRSMDADAYVVFSMGKTGKATGITMEAISPLTDFSFDFQDLDFKRAE